MSKNCNCMCNCNMNQENSPLETICDDVHTQTI